MRVVYIIYPTYKHTWARVFLFICLTGFFSEYLARAKKMCRENKFSG